ncbi:Holliday junction resolvase RuvX [Myxococcota bacterium]|nr:Holliday junction resolvase RuvX [Myxococcota bacterium]
MRWLGLDIGQKRIGVAVSDEAEMFAFPLTVIQRTSLGADVKAVLALIAEHGVAGVVVGEPLEMSGKVGAAVLRTRVFTDALRLQYGGELIFVDERFSTVEAERVLLSADTSRARRKQVVDKVAASVILQQHLERKKA